MKKSITSGFTLVELLVVIAIIGILSSVVLVSLSTARGKGNDSRVESELESLRNQAEIYNTNNAYSYTGLFVSSAWDSTDPGVKKVLDAIAADDPSGTKYANNNATSWAATAQLPSSVGTTTVFWCVDSQGVAGKWNGSSDPDGTELQCQ